jgi:hypothetical protein
MAHREESVSAGTKSIAPVTINRIPVYVAGIPTPTIKDSIFAQTADAHSVLVGVGAALNAGQVVNKPAVIIGESASGWGDGAVAIGKNAIGGLNAARDAAVAIGTSVTVDGKNGVRIGSGLAVGGAFDDTIAIGTQASAIRPGVCIGKLASQAGPDGIAIGTSSVASEGSSIAIGRGAGCTNSGLGTPNKNVAIGDAAACSPTFASAGGGVVAVGASALSHGQDTVAVGATAQIVGGGVIGSIVIGNGANTARSHELVIGDNGHANWPITLVTIKAGAAADVLHRVGGSGAWGIRDAGDANTLFKIDSSVTAGDSRMLIWDVSGTTVGLKRVTFGADNSAGAGFKWLRVLN